MMVDDPLTLVKGGGGVELRVSMRQNNGPKSWPDFDVKLHFKADTGKNKTDYCQIYTREAKM